MTETDTAIRTPEIAVDGPGQPALEAAADRLLRAMIEADLDDHRWASARPLVSAAAQQLQRAQGAAVRDNLGSVPAVVSEADFALAMRPLLAEVVVVDSEAAGHFVRLAAEAALAFVRVPGGYSRWRGREDRDTTAG